MARHTVTVTITAEGRDKGKTFIITEMSSENAEDWGFRAMNAISKAMGGIPEAILEAGLPGLAALGVSAFARADWLTIKPLIDEMFTCISIVPDPAKPEVVRANLVSSDIEEVKTRLQLRQEVLDLHLGFFKAAVDWIWTAVQLRLKQPEMGDATSGMPT